MLAMALIKRQYSSIIPLLYTWNEKSLSLRHLFPSIIHNPFIGSSETIHEKTAMFHMYCSKIILKLIAEKIICIKKSVEKSVETIDLSGFIIHLNTLQDLLNTKFTSSEKVILIIDIGRVDDVCLGKERFTKNIGNRNLYKLSTIAEHNLELGSYTRTCKFGCCLHEK